MQNNFLKRRILVVAMRPPTRIPQVHLDVSRDRRRRAELDDGGAKIRPALDAPKPRMKHAQGLTVQGAQLVAPQALLLPDGLQEFLWGHGWRLVKGRDNRTSGPPFSIEVGRDGLHLELLLRWRSRKVKRRK